MKLMNFCLFISNFLSPILDLPYFFLTVFFQKANNSTAFLQETVWKLKKLPTLHLTTKQSVSFNFPSLKKSQLAKQRSMNNYSRMNRLPWLVTIFNGRLIFISIINDSL